MSSTDSETMSPIVASALHDMLNRARPGDAATEGLETDMPRKASLGDLLSKARMADDGVLDFEVDLEELGADLRAKVDNVTEYLDYCYARAEAIAKRAKMLADKARAFRGRAERLEQYVAFRLAEDVAERKARGEPIDGTYRVGGADFEFLLMHSERVTPKRQPDAGLYLKLKSFIRREYTWDLAALKKALKGNDAAVTPFADITRHPYLEIKPKA